MPTRYKIHPGIGIARLGNSPDEFCISPEEPAALPLDCDAQGNPLLSPDGESELRVGKFKDEAGRIKRQAARFQVFVYDDETPAGRPLQLGDPVSGGGNQGTLIDIQWRVHLANKKASWYQFKQLEGEHGYAPDHPRRNASIVEPEARQKLIIDPGPRMVDRSARRTASFDRRSGEMYAPTFPPALKPQSINTLGDLLTDDAGRLLVLGGHGDSGSFLYDDFGQPRIDTYANTDGWFDDTSDGPVMARLVMYSKEVDTIRFVDVEYPAWVIAGYPAYVPQILDVVTMTDTVEDMFVRDFAYRTDLYGEAGTFSEPEVVDPTDREALMHWKAGRLEWNPDYKPWFYRDVWPILFRPDEYSFLTNVLGLSNYPHNQSPRGNFDPSRLGVPPRIERAALEACERACIAKHRSGELLIEALAPALDLLGAGGELLGTQEDERATSQVPDAGALLRRPLAAFARTVVDDPSVSGVDAYLELWRSSTGSPAYEKAKEDLEKGLAKLLRRSGRAGRDPRATPLESLVREQLDKYLSGELLEDCRARCVEAATVDPYRDYRVYLFDALRQRGEENRFRVGSKPTSRIHGLPLMPLLAGDNPLSNTLPSKFFRLTDLQYFLLRQWARGLFYNEVDEHWDHPDPWVPYAGWVNRTGRDLDRGVMSNILGGSFCPGGEVGWIMRNPAIYAEPYRIKADPDFYSFRRTAAQSNWDGFKVPEPDYTFYVDVELAQDDDFETGMQPGDLTKHMAVPWQADFNECTTQPIDVTYEGWNTTYAASEHDALMRRETEVWETLWWPAHRPLQTWVATSYSGGAWHYQWLDWSRGIPQTNAGDLKMVTEWSHLGFVVLNPYAQPPDLVPSEVPPTNKYIAVERTEEGS